MKSLVLILCLISLLSCSINKGDYIGRSFVNYAHMQGESVMNFENDSIFSLSKRGGMLFTKGTWRVSGTDKSLILESFQSNKFALNRFKGDTALYFAITGDNKVILKSKKKIVFQNTKYILMR